MYLAHFTLRCCSINAAKIFRTKSMQVYIGSFQISGDQVTDSAWRGTTLGAAPALLLAKRGGQAKENKLVAGSSGSFECKTNVTRILASHFLRQERVPAFKRLASFFLAPKRPATISRMGCIN